MTIPSQAALGKERKKTDDSLVVEREKTDNSLEDYRGKAEGKTDKIVTKSRLDADDARKQNRSATRDKGVIAQRSSEDTALQAEREDMDSALRFERKEKERLIVEMVSQERKTTDEDLQVERTKTDSELQSSVDLLSVEQRAHRQTKSTLTSREEFVAIVSHDLRNPIGVVLSSCDMLLTEPGVGPVTADAKILLDLIKRNAQVSLQLISDILDMERISAGEIDIELAACSLQRIIRETLDNSAHEAQIKQVTLGFVEAHLPRRVSCDESRIRQVLSNLVSNALKFSPVGGRIRVAVDQQETRVVVSITDDGPGVPLDKQVHIFERYAQLGNKDRQGLGLGLYISKTIIESHKGNLWVESTPGEGSTFCFSLPAPH